MVNRLNQVIGQTKKNIETTKSVCSSIRKKNRDILESAERSLQILSEIKIRGYRG